MEASHWSRRGKRWAGAISLPRQGSDFGRLVRRRALLSSRRRLTHFQRCFEPPLHSRRFPSPSSLALRRESLDRRVKVEAKSTPRSHVSFSPIVSRLSATKFRTLTAHHPDASLQVTIVHRTFSHPALHLRFGLVFARTRRKR